MSLCKTCKHVVKDWEINVNLIPDKDVMPQIRTWMICELNLDDFPFTDDCQQYEDKHK